MVMPSAMKPANMLTCHLCSSMAECLNEDPLIISGSSFGATAMLGLLGVIGIVCWLHGGWHDDDRFGGPKSGRRNRFGPPIGFGGGGLFGICHEAKQCP